MVAPHATAVNVVALPVRVGRLLQTAVPVDHRLAEAQPFAAVDFLRHRCAYGLRAAIAFSALSTNALPTVVFHLA